MKWDGRYVAGVSKVSALKRTTEVVEHREGGDPSTSRKSPGRTKYEAITLERGVTHDLEFEQWANKVWNFGSGLGAEVSLKDFRKDLIIELYNEAGQVVLAYKVFRAWVSEYQALPDLDANANAVAIQTLKLENEGWERDYDVAEPSRAVIRRAVRAATGRPHVSDARPELLDLWERAGQPRPGRARAGAGRSAAARTRRSRAGPAATADRTGTCSTCASRCSGPRPGGHRDLPRVREPRSSSASTPGCVAARRRARSSHRRWRVRRRWRPPTADDLLAVVGIAGPRASALLARGCAGEPATWPRRRSALLDRGTCATAADPLAEVLVGAGLPASAGQASSPTSTSRAFVWAEVEAGPDGCCTRSTVLARAYGWTEPEVLDLTEARRAAYLRAGDGQGAHDRIPARGWPAAQPVARRAVTPRVPTRFGTPRPSSGDRFVAPTPDPSGAGPPADRVECAARRSGCGRTPRLPVDADAAAPPRPERAPRCRCQSEATLNRIRPRRRHRVPPVGVRVADAERRAATDRAATRRDGDRRRRCRPCPHSRCRAAATAP